MTEPLVSFRVSAHDTDAPAAWADGMRLTVPGSVADCLRPHVVGSQLNVHSEMELIDTSAAAMLREFAAFTEVAPISSRAPVAYTRVPEAMRTAVGRLVGLTARLRRRSWASFPSWPLDLSADIYADLATKQARPPSGPTPVLLTHDRDSAQGLENLVRRFFDIEESYGARSCNYVVPCAWPIDHGLLDEVATRGNEIGIHGYDHSNRTAFADPAERARRLDAPRGLSERYDVMGYRAPSLLRTRALLRDVGARYRYDSSIPTSGGLFPTPNNGCATARPFETEGTMELPITLPRDGTLRFLGHTPEQVLELWKSCADCISRSGGIVNLLTHCEDRFTGGSRMLARYQELLEFVASDPRFTFALPRSLLNGDRVA